MSLKTILHGSALQKTAFLAIAMHFYLFCLVSAGLLVSTSANALVVELSNLNGETGFQLLGVDASDGAGRDVGDASDINGDGIDDVVITAPGASVAGETYVVFGRNTDAVGNFPVNFELSGLAGGNGTQGFVLRGNAAFLDVVGDIDAIGDINNDGIGDLIIGTPNAGPNGASSGRSYVLFGRNTPVVGNFPAVIELSSLSDGDGSLGFVLNGVSAGDSSGAAVSAAGDIDGDGIDDVMVSAPGADPNGNSSGAVYVLFGKDTSASGNFPPQLELNTLSTAGGSTGFVIHGVGAGSALARLGQAGDINDDGQDDIILGAPRAPLTVATTIGPGQAYVLFGRDTAVSGNFAQIVELSNLAGGIGDSGFVLNGIAAGDLSGASVNGVGDINADGVDDLIIGATFADPGGNNSGQAYVVFGRDTTTAGNFPGQFELSSLISGSGTNGFVANGSGLSAGIGSSTGPAGDFNGDGIDDLLIGASLRGDAYIVFGRDTGVEGNFAATIELTTLAELDARGLVIRGELPSVRNAAMAGDVNSDGITDLIITDPEFGANGSRIGRAFVLLAPGANIQPAQITVPDLQIGLEDMPIVFNGTLSVSHPTVPDLELTVGTPNQLFRPILTVNDSGSAVIQNNNTDFVSISGSIAEINVALDGLQYLPAPDANLNQSMRLVASDGYFSRTAFASFFLEAVNDPPTFTITQNPIVILEDENIQTVLQLVTDIDNGDPETPGGAGIFVSNTDNTALFVEQPALEARNLTFQAAPNANGSATITITATDSGGTNNGGVNTTSMDLTFTITPVNDAPVFVVAGDQVVDEDAGPQTVPGFLSALDDGDPEAEQTIVLTVSDDNAGLFSAAPAIDSDGQLTYTPAPNANGVAVVTVNATDDGGVANGGIDSSQQQFSITVNAVNDAPSFIAGPALTVDDTEGEQSVFPWATGISAGPANENDQSVQFNVVSNSNPDLFASAPSVEQNGALNFTPALNQSGVASIGLTLMDDGPAGGVNQNISPIQNFTIEIALEPSADLAITKQNGANFINNMEPAMYMIIVDNLGSEDVIGATVQDTLPTTLDDINAFWTCSPTGAATCMATGTGNINDSVNIPAGDRLEYFLTADVLADEDDVITNTATVVPPPTLLDRNLDNNSATDTDPIALFADGMESE